jgi:hypothetical protein
MGNLFVGKILLSIAGQPAPKRVEIELQPIQPGAWAVWAKSCADEQAATQAKVEGKAPKLVPAALAR